MGYWLLMSNFMTYIIYAGDIPHQEQSHHNANTNIDIYYGCHAHEETSISKIVSFAKYNYLHWRKNTMHSVNANIIFTAA